MDAKYVDPRAIEAAAVEASRRGTDYLLKVESVLDRLLDLGCKDMPNDLQELFPLIASARNFAWAMRRFPTFDLSCLSQMQKKPIKVFAENRNNFDRETALMEFSIWVPVFAMSQVQQHNWGGTSNFFDQVQWRPESETYTRDIKFDPILIKENQQEISSKKNDRTRFMDVTLTAKPPVVPGPIVRNVSHVSARFEETALVWEAQWEASVRVQDPFVLGRIGHRWFVLDHFDATKLERYVLAEFCKKPVE